MGDLERLYTAESGINMVYLTWYSSEQRRGSSRAAWSVECARDTDKALGESQLSRPLTRAAATPSTGVCAPPMCRHPCTSALTRKLACTLRLLLVRLGDHFKTCCVSISDP